MKEKYFSSEANEQDIKFHSPKQTPPEKRPKPFLPNGRIIDLGTCFLDTSIGPNVPMVQETDIPIYE